MSMNDPTNSLKNPHHMYIPSKPHRNGTLLTSVADEENVVLSYAIRRRITEDFDPLTHRSAPDMIFQRTQFQNCQKKKM